MAGSNPYPVRVPVVLERFSEGAKDALGNPVESWEGPETVNVVGVEPAVATEPITVGTNRVVVDAKMYAPTAVGFGPGDRVTVDGIRFLVVGFPGRADLGPWWKLPLCTVLLKAVDG